MQIYEGYLEKGQFYPMKPIEIDERCRAVITVIDDVVPKQSETIKANVLRKIFDIINTNGEKIPDKFERVNFTREIVI